MTVEKTASASDGAGSVVLEFEDNSVLPVLYGRHDEHLARIEQQLEVSIASRGNTLAISGSPSAVEAADSVLKALYNQVKSGLDVGSAEVDAVVRMVRHAEDPAGGRQAAARLHSDELAFATRKRRIIPRSPGQVAYVKALTQKDLVFGVGPAGTGKTYLAVARGVQLLIHGKIDRIILSRPAVEAGERLGFLPGDLLEKVNPYLRPLYDALYDMLPADQVMTRLSNGEIEVAPLAFMRGRTLSNAFVILDEAQNTTATQMKMFLTRFGENSSMVVTGDLSQVDLPKNERSGLKDAIDVLANIDRIAFVQFTDADVVRHSLVTRIVQAYEARDASPHTEPDLFEGGRE